MIAAIAFSLAMGSGILAVLVSFDDLPEFLQMAGYAFFGMLAACLAVVGAVAL